MVVLKTPSEEPRIISAGGTRQQTEQRSATQVKTIFMLAVSALILLVPPLALDIILFRSASSGASPHDGLLVVPLLDALRIERSGALFFIETSMNSSLTSFQRSQPFLEAQTSTDATIKAIVEAYPNIPELRLAQSKLASVRSSVTGGTVVPLSAEAKYAEISIISSRIILRLAALDTSPAIAKLLAISAALDEAAMGWARASSTIQAAASSALGGFSSSLQFQTVIGSMNTAAAAASVVQALYPDEVTTQSISTTTTPKATRSTTLDLVFGIVVGSISLNESSSLVLPTAAMLSSATVNTSLPSAFDSALESLAGAVISVQVEVAQLVVTVLSCVSIVSALAALMYVTIMRRAVAGSANDNVIAQMNAAYDRVRILMDSLLRFKSELPLSLVDGPALSPTEAELRRLLRPLARAVSHVPRTALSLTGANCVNENDPLAGLDAAPSLRHNVTLLVIDLQSLNDFAVTADAAKMMPARANRLRAGVLSEVLRWGGLSVMSPVNRWSFAWNLTHFDKSGTQNAVQCALDIINGTTADFPNLRCALLTGTVAVGSPGTSTYRAELLAGLPVMLHAVSLRIAQMHHTQLVADAETQANCSMVSHRARPIEMIGPTGDTSASTALYDMLSTFDHQDERWRQWRAAFDKYSRGLVGDALEALRAWAREGTADRTANRLISLLESNPPRTVTREGSMEVFSSVAMS